MIVKDRGIQCTSNFMFAIVGDFSELCKVTVNAVPDICFVFHDVVFGHLQAC